MIDKPGDFALGSVQSRAAARALLERREVEGLRVIIGLLGHPHGDCLGRWCIGRTCELLECKWTVSGGEVWIEERKNARGHAQTR
jgi:hypothetical protein